MGLWWVASFLRSNGKMNCVISTACLERSRKKVEKSVDWQKLYCVLRENLRDEVVRKTY
jgi:hypothetical protein